jgi:hypothetical protein
MANVIPLARGADLVARSLRVCAHRFAGLEAETRAMAEGHARLAEAFDRLDASARAAGDAIDEACEDAVRRIDLQIASNAAVLAALDSGDLAEMERLRDALRAGAR